MAPVETIEAATIPAPTIQVEVLLALPERAWSVQLSLLDGATVFEALEQARPQFPQLPETEWIYGIYGRLVTSATLLRDGDRIELLRPLLADPMDQRRQRASRNPRMVRKG
jgi:putative ubiquitin-RnfH superfamily antitoxin RatB of RatAB toxin-antitoxin module